MPLNMAAAPTLVVVPEDDPRPRHGAPKDQFDWCLFVVHGAIRLRKHERSLRGLDRLQ
jgi:hypothetical protein